MWNLIICFIWFLIDDMRDLTISFKEKKKRTFNVYWAVIRTELTKSELHKDIYSFVLIDWYIFVQTTGMDPVTRRYVWDIIEDAKKGRAIVLTTHSMEEAPKAPWIKEGVKKNIPNESWNSSEASQTLWKCNSEVM